MSLGLSTDSLSLMENALGALRASPIYYSSHLSRQINQRRWEGWPFQALSGSRRGFLKGWYYPPLLACQSRMSRTAGYRSRQWLMIGLNREAASRGCKMVWLNDSGRRGSLKHGRRSDLLYQLLIWWDSFLVSFSKLLKSRIFWTKLCGLMLHVLRLEPIFP